MRTAVALPVAAVALSLAGCGNGAASSGPSVAASDQQAIQSLFSAYISAIAHGRSGAVCAMQSASFTGWVRRQARRAVHRKVTCDEAVQMVTGGSGADAITKITVTGDSASARVGRDTWTFVRDGSSWKVNRAE